MSTILQRVAKLHRDRVAKKDKKRLDRKMATARAAAYFKDSGIPEMWEEIKDIKIKNPAMERVEGLVVTFNDLIDPIAEEPLQKTGLVLFEKEARVMWYVEQARDGQLFYRADHDSAFGNHEVSEKDAKQKDEKRQTKMTRNFDRTKRKT